MTDKTAFITGGARGIGSEIARQLYKDGWEIIINYNRSKQQAEALAQELDARIIQGDVGDFEQAEEMFNIAGNVDLLVNNAGVALYGLLTDTTPWEWGKLINTNLTGVYNCCKCAVPFMVRQKWGCIINISSVWGIAGASCEAAYSASKAGVIALTKSLAKELGYSGIRVNCVAPGVIDTDMISNLSVYDKESLSNDTPLGRLGSALDVAELVSFLVSDKASFITGQVISVDGGFLL